MTKLPEIEHLRDQRQRDPAKATRQFDAAFPALARSAARPLEFVLSPTTVRIGAWE